MVQPRRRISSADCSTSTAWRTWRRSKSTGARNSAPCWPTKKSPTTASQSAATHPVFKRPLKQWMLRITAYADRLIKDLDERRLARTHQAAATQLDRQDPSARKSISPWKPSRGVPNRTSPRRAGSRVKPFASSPPAPTRSSARPIMVLAPEHELVNLASPPTPEQRRCGRRTINGRPRPNPASTGRRGDKEKTGVFTGAYAINPVNGESIPIWIADYVMMGYGTGAIMAVPAHDHRDHAFAPSSNCPSWKSSSPPRITTSSSPPGPARAS